MNQKIVIEIMWVWLWTAAMLAPNVIQAQHQCADHRADEIWLVSARNFCHDAACLPGQIPVQKFDGACWQESCMDALQSTESSRLPTVVFVHGYQTNLEYAQKRGLQVFENLFQRGCSDRGPVRYVIWAWRSEREVARPIKDYARISKRSVAIGNFFAQTLSQFANEKTTVLGYSLGAQVVVSGMTGASQYFGPPVRLAVVAGANDCDFESDFLGCDASQNILETTIFFNSKDRALKAANLRCRIRNGRSFRKFGEFAVENSMSFGCLKVIDISCRSTPKHSIVRYSELPIVRNEILKLVDVGRLNSVQSRHDVDDAFRGPAAKIEEESAVLFEAS